MTLVEMADQLAGKHGMDKKAAKSLIESVFQAIQETAVKGEEVSVAGFGKFKVSDRPARTGRNPSTGEMIEIAASRKLAFTPAKQLRDALNAASGKA